ncbi:MAG: hypothetical protein H6739_25470 [Alphaproteobacteria bacterium]|nr:hypothetical protein [Alphaproteobacteria bacterium]
MGPLLLGLLTASPSLAQDEPEEKIPLDFSLEGYYRVRLHHFNGLYDPDFTGWENEPGTGRYTQQRLRLEPTVAYKDLAKFTFQADLFNDVLFGDNEDLASTALFAEQPSMTGLDGQPTAPFTMRRAWMEFNAKVGVVRVGRQPSHWGLGVLANDGNGFRNTWGEAHGGATFDRFLFATRPIAVVQGITKKEGPDIPLFVIFAVDRLVEDPLTQYYGYKCSDDPEDTDHADCEDDEDHSYTEARNTAARAPNWWTEHEDDVIEFVYAVLYKGEGLDLAGAPADLTAGFYAVNRRQLETSSNVWILDAYAKLDHRNIYFEGEGVTILGHSSAITLPDPSNEADPLAKTPKIWNAVGRLGYELDKVGVIFESGFASGDDNVSDEVFTGRPINPDYNVGLILYEEVISRVSAARWTASGRGLWSNGGVYNSVYTFPSVRVTPLDNVDVIAAFLVAWPHKPDGAVIRLDEDAESNILGWEADLAVKARLHEHVLLSFEGGYARVTDRLPTADVGLAMNDRVWTIQARAAYEF